MRLPNYFKNIEPIILYDELSKFLGTSEDGELEIHFSEIVKMAGHSCPTVTGAWLMTKKGLEALYGNEKPVRGNIKVELRDSAKDGSVGVSASIFTNITGAAGPHGFDGIGDKFIRRKLLSFGANIDGFVRFTRIDTNKSVEVKYRPANLVHPSNLMMTAIGPKADDTSKEAFPKLWQEMVEQLFENSDKVVFIL
ncbi:MAG: hypothetical protein C0598_00200 [Marinilabiliales bacterium]|nr:MAG: hypothetical protein C0598_00200 [Marinilabiliales bacterium]